ncbi:MAG: hypothetical protein KatS3mg056_1903 [Chloroflexus sp.]|nr:MAG: hypothetical protein KatS3mg056_1903 [Chloroflexus sp.]
MFLLCITVFACTEVVARVVGQASERWFDQVLKLSHLVQ